MTCELNIIDCNNMAMAAHKIRTHIGNITKEIDDYRKRYGDEDILVESSLSDLNSAIETRVELIKIANKCDCNIDLTTGQFK